MQLVRRFRISALFCALAVLLAELVSRPYAEIGIVDDGPYILIARTLSVTGHIVYNGPTTPFLGWQLYLGAVFIKLFGFSFTAVRMSTLLVAVVMAFLLQRTLVRANITDRNATIATLALVLSPLYLTLSVTYMTDIFGLFGIVICLYGCLRALQASTSRATIAWLCFAVATNAVFGSSRQVCWFGVLVLVPSTLWLLRAQRRVLLAGLAANAAGVLFILSCMLWFLHQPYNVHEGLFPAAFSAGHALRQFLHTFLDLPFLLLPITAVFIPQIRNSRARVILLIIALSYALLAIHWWHSRLDVLLEPTQIDWVTAHGSHEDLALNGYPPIFLHTPIRALLTLLSIGGLISVIASFFPSRDTPVPTPASHSISWEQLGILLAPLSIAYLLILIPRAGTAGIADRYVLELLVVLLLCLVRYDQDRIHPHLPATSILLVGVMAIYGIAVTHNLLAFYRARITLAAELHAAGIPDTSIDNGSEENFVVELRHSAFINDSRMLLPAHAYAPPPPLPAGTCAMFLSDQTPHIHPLYGISFDPDACYGPASFAPVYYSRWLSSLGALYVVRYTPHSKP